MKGKARTYLLLGAVLVIWGILGFKVVSTLSPKTIPKNTLKFDVAFQPHYSPNTDTFSIQPPQRDPFLGTLAFPKPITAPTLPRKRQVLDTIAIAVSYLGTVSQNQGKDPVFVIATEGRQYLLKKGQKVQGITLVRGDDKHIVIGYKGLTKSIPKS